ncbi:bacteriocin biosynthesis protein [Pseudoalteromonas aurantia]|uniref:Bacteriocin biosynthesis protein n=1 Tax=Pseudoalteromonas aurantia TaxID=43654 RepID=A0ABY2W374_9GAMM|nr:bacteriocin biosynthesis protein [Pseudoalteromonas aurantia]
MPNKIPKWSKHYTAYELKNKDLLIAGCEQEFLFTNEKYPLFYLINGERSLSDIVNHSLSDKQAEHFLYLIDQFVTQCDFLGFVDVNTAKNNKKFKIEVKTLNTTLTVLSNDYDCAALVINEVIKENSTNTRFFIAHSFIDQFLFNELNTVTQNCAFSVIVITNTKVLISPLFNDLSEYIKFTELLERNTPVAQTFKTSLDVEFTRPLPPSLRANSIATLKDKFKDAFTCHTNSKSKNLTELSFKSGEIIKHSYTPLIYSNSFLKNKITLQSKPHFNSKDGGSRCVEASLTVKKILPFVSPLTGLITHLEPLKKGVNSPITIYRTGFFKTLPKNKLHTIKNDSFVQACLGKGVSKEQSMASALCEAIERKNAQFIGNEQSYLSTRESLSVRAYSFEQHSFYSSNQYEAFKNSIGSNENKIVSVLPYDGADIYWHSTWSLSHNEPVYAPTVLCFANTPFEEDKFGKWQSNGCAAGNNLEEAILQALFELIERDATAIWWYNKLERPSFDLTRLDPDYLTPLHQTLSNEHDYWVLDLTVDTGVPVMAAIGRNKQSEGLIFGFGCHLKPEMAAQRALTELCQLIPIRNQNGAPFDFDAIEPESYLFANDQAPRGVYALSETLDIKDDILAIVEHLKCLDLETLALDYTRPPIPIHTAKVFVPGLCHIWPQLGNKRLYNTPIKLGWLDEPLNEQTINQQGLYI